MNSVQQVLADAKALIASPDRWTAGCMARDAGGNSVHPESPVAVKFCLFGALYRGWQLHTTAAARKAMLAAAGSEDGLIIFNDTHTHAEVLALLDKGIALAGEQP